MGVSCSSPSLGKKKTRRAKELLVDFDINPSDNVLVVEGMEIVRQTVFSPIDDTSNECEWRTATGMNINYFLDQGYHVTSHAPGDCVWMARPRSSTA